MDSRNEVKAMGWVRDIPDFRDYTIDREDKNVGDKYSINIMLGDVGALETKASLPPKVDLRKWCSAIEDQEDIGSCTAQAAVGLVEYFENKAFGKHLDASRLFLYKVTRNLLHWTGDTGAYLRTTMGALVLFGVPPEEYWPYVTADYDIEPPAFNYSYAQNYQAIRYYRLDPFRIKSDALLKRIKTNLAAQLPAMFGFSVYSSYTQALKSGKIPFPTTGENKVGGHAVCAVGYDDSMKINNSNPNSKETKGALLIRNSWGTDWGEDGYGWLPYKYVLEGLAVDWWSLLKSEWIETGKFGLL